MTWLCTFCWRELCAHWKRQGRRREVALAEDEPVTRAALEILRPRRDDVILHGSVEGMTPEEALAAVLPTGGLEFEIDGDSLIIRSIKAR
jgi:DNA-directed RNA polymerase specialized sigma24 family protein